MKPKPKPKSKSNTRTRAKAAAKLQRRPSIGRARNKPRSAAVLDTVPTDFVETYRPTLPAMPTLQPSIVAAFDSARAVGMRIASGECPDSAPAYDSLEPLQGMVGEALQIAAHEKAVIDELLYHLEARKRELQEELTSTLAACDLTESPISVRGCVVRYVKSHSSKLDKSELLKRGVAASVIEASTVRSDYAYAKVTVPGLRESA